VLEFLTRFFFPAHPTPFVPSNDPQLIYELNPQYPEINSLGMRQAEFDPASLHDRFVIAVVGDSHTYSGEAKKWENSFPARLEYHLKLLSAQNVKVLNLGVPGYNMHQELEVLRAKAIPLRPDLIILQYCINDEHISNYIQPEYVWLNRAIHKSEFLSRAWKKFLYSRIGKKLILGYIEEYFPDLLLDSPGLVGTRRAHDADPAHAPHPPRNKNEVPARYWDFVGRDNLERDVRAFGLIAEKVGIRIIATGFVEDQDKKLYETSGFQVYSFFEIFRGLDMRDYGYSGHTYDHFSDTGSDYIGKAMANFVYQHYDITKVSY
jgi:hypothetical protein